MEELILLWISILFQYFKWSYENLSWLCPLFQMWRQEVRAMEKLEKLEGNLVKEVSGNSENKNAFAIGGLDEVEAKVRGTLQRNVKAWEDAGAGPFALSVIKDGFKLNINQMPEAYEEGNNKSFKKDEE